VPYTLVVGEKEAADGTVSARLRGSGGGGGAGGRGALSQLPPMKVADFAAYVEKKVRTQSLEL
jgi:threonyl-tRNA synthetase